MPGWWANKRVALDHVLVAVLDNPKGHVPTVASDRGRWTAETDKWSLSLKKKVTMPKLLKNLLASVKKVFLLIIISVLVAPKQIAYERMSGGWVAARSKPS